MHTHIVMLGAGYVSVWAYRSIMQKIGGKVKSGEVKITVISPETVHVFHGFTAEALTGVIAFENRLSPVAEIMPYASHLQGRAVGVDCNARKVKVFTSNGAYMYVNYDHLLVGMGSFDSMGVKGVETFGYRVKDPLALNATMAEINRIVKQAAEYPTEAAGLLRFAVAGAGFTGVEMAANLVEYIRIAMKKYDWLHGVKPVVSLIYSTPQILPEINGRFGRMQRYAQRQLSRYGIQQHAGIRIREITTDGAVLDDGTLIPATMVISTVGQSRLVLDGTETFRRDLQGRIHLNAFLLVPGYTNIWGGGDACHVKQCISRQPCPSNALWAIKHGEYAGRNIARHIEGKPIEAFSYPGLGQSASLGMGKGITEFYGLQFTGLIAWIMRWFFFNYFMPSKRTMLRSMGDWMRCWFTGKRIALVTSKKSSKKILPYSNVGTAAA